MNILFIFSRHSADASHSTLTKNLSDYFNKQGHNVYIATILERREKKETTLSNEHGCQVLRVKCGNYFNTSSRIEKGLTVVSMPRMMKKSIIKYFGEIKLDLIYTHTPFMASHSLISPLKKHFKCKTLLNLWDIFPQNAKDLGLLTNSFLFNFFKTNEVKTLKSFDYIACMSKGNIKYVKDNYDHSIHSKLFLLKNWAPHSEQINENVRSNYLLPLDQKIIVFGGNIGKPQAIHNIINLAKRFKNKDVLFLFIGDGTEKEIVIKACDQYSHIRFIESLPRDQYEKLIASCDIAIVSLDERFTIPNFPSKTTDYFKLSLPIIASLDKSAYEDYGSFLECEAGAGLRSLAGDIDKLEDNLNKMLFNNEERRKMGINGRKYFEENLTTRSAFDTIMNFLADPK